jgi:hypothetical protein
MPKIAIFRYGTKLHTRKTWERYIAHLRGLQGVLDKQTITARGPKNALYRDGYNYQSTRFDNTRKTGVHNVCN